MTFKNIQTEREEIEQWDTNNVVNQITQSAQSNHSASEFLKRYLNTYIKKRILPNVIEFQISVITISSILFNVIMIKYEAAVKASIHIIKNKFSHWTLRSKEWILTTFLSTLIP